MKGIIIKGVGGFYHVKTDEGIFQCKAKGIFRKKFGKPLAGDRVEISLVEDKAEIEGMIDIIEERKNSLIRPPIANIDVMFIVMAAANPDPSLIIVDKMVAICEDREIEPVIVINKIDLKDVSGIVAIYEKAGFTVIPASAETGVGISEIRAEIGGRICAFTGHSGVGKSSLLNLIDSHFGAEVGEISRKTDRGRHTTRHVELYETAGGYIADTPGFGDISIERFEMVRRENLEFSFREFGPYLGKCRFAGCIHDKEIGCAVKAAVDAGEIGRARYESYLYMYNEVRDQKDWEMKD